MGPSNQSPPTVKNFTLHLRMDLHFQGAMGLLQDLHSILTLSLVSVMNLR